MAEKQLQYTNGITLTQNKIRKNILTTDDPTLKKRISAIRLHEDLVQLLMFRQPLSTKEIRSELYQPKESLLRALKQLIKLEIVKKISFESHTLYVIDGHFNTLVKNTLNL